jgi:hypothetical protein
MYADSSELHILHLMTDNVEQFVRNQKSQNPYLPFIENAQFITAVDFISIAVSADFLF